jgi:exportin-T
MLLCSLVYLPTRIGQLPCSFSRRPPDTPISSRFVKSVSSLLWKLWSTLGQSTLLSVASLAHIYVRRGLHNENSAFRLRLFYLFYKFIKEGRDDIPTDICAGIIASVQDLLQIEVEIPKLDDSETDLLAEVARSSAFDSQLYLYETAGMLCSLLFKSPEEQASLLLSLMKPLMDELSVNLQAATKGSQEIVPIVKVHHIIMALGNIAKGFPDYPQPLPQGYILPPLDVFAQVAQAILVCLEAMNIIKIVRDAVCTLFSCNVRS